MLGLSLLNIPTLALWQSNGGSGPPPSGGATRVLDDGATIRVLADGTTQRVIEGS